MEDLRIDSKGLHYKILNERIRMAIESGAKKIILDNINGQRYIGDAIFGKDVAIEINGTPGNDLAAFMDGPELVINGNCQDGTGNTMNDGKIVVNGSTGDITGYSMRGGKIFVKGDVGYRVGIHMKSYKELYPVIIAGGTACDFLGEYMAGGLIVILGLENKDPIVGNYVGTGMHGGTIYIRGKVEEYQIGKEVKITDVIDGDETLPELRKYLEEYCEDFRLNFKEVMREKFIKLAPASSRPYGKLYA